jgi:hypothetical protein
VHHGADGFFAEGVGEHLVGAGDEASAVGVSGGCDLLPSDAGGFEFLESVSDTFGDFWREELGVSGISHGAEAVVHGAGSAVGVGGGDENVFNGNAGGFGSELLGLVADITGDHAAIDNSDGDTGVSAAEDKTAGLEITWVHFATTSLGEAAVDEEGIEGRSDILHVGACFERWFKGNGVIGRKIEPESKEAAQDAAEESGR